MYIAEVSFVPGAETRKGGSGGREEKKNEQINGKNRKEVFS